MESGQNTAGFSIAQGEDNLSCFCVNVYVVDMIPDKLSQDRSLCSSLCSNKVAGNSGNWGIVSVTLCLRATLGCSSAQRTHHTQSTWFRAMFRVLLWALSTLLGVSAS